METMQITEANKYSTGDIAKWIRQTLKKEFSDLKFSVRTQFYSGGSSLHVAVMESQNTRFLKKMSEISEREVRHLMTARNDSEEEVMSMIKNLLESESYSLNQYHMDSDWGLTDKGKEVLKKVLAVIQKYNHDNSDVQSDYFDVNYYVNFDLGKWDKAFIDGGAQ